jgi:predicted kinase
MKLIILNGPSGVGKSTVASRLLSDIPNSVLVDIDELRRSIPNYRERREESSQLSYQKAKEGIEAGLKNGQTVIVDKTISRSDTLDSFIESGRKFSADVYEIFLFADKEAVQKRADARGYRPGSLLSRKRVGELWDQLELLRAQRSEALVIDTGTITLEGTYEQVKTFVL